METLKGQHLRIFVYDEGEEKFQVIGMATNCTITLNTNVQNSSTKDDVGIYALPTVLSKSWQVQVESLQVLGAASLLRSIGQQTKYTLIWDETSDAGDNQDLLEANFARKGEAYISDAVFTFNDRENSVKQITFTGTGELTTEAVTDESMTIEQGSYTKGQFVRLFLMANASDATGAVIAAARQLQLHVSLALENSTTKDTTGDWDVMEPTELNYDISTTALVRSGDTITSQVVGKSLNDLESIYEGGLPANWQIANVTGANNRTKGSLICHGRAIINQLTINAPNRQVATYTAQLQGYGAYSVGA